MKKLFGYAMEGISAFSTKLLLIPLIVGVILAAVAILPGGDLEDSGCDWRPDDYRQWAWLALLILFLAGVRSSVLG